RLRHQHAGGERGKGFECIEVRGIRALHQRVVLARDPRARVAVVVAVRAAALGDHDPAVWQQRGDDDAPVRDAHCAASWRAAIAWSRSALNGLPSYQFGHLSEPASSRPTPYIAARSSMVPSSFQVAGSYSSAGLW